MKHLIIILGTLCITLSSIAQQVYVSYTYDAAGNRTLRQLVIDLNNNKNETVSDSTYDSDISYTDSSIVDKMANQTITLYPNPTSGQITIEGSDIVLVEVYNALGELIQKNENILTSNTVDLSHCVNGIYIVKIHLPDRTREWKVIKK